MEGQRKYIIMNNGSTTLDGTKLARSIWIHFPCLPLHVSKILFFFLIVSCKSVFKSRCLVFNLIKVKVVTKFHLFHLHQLFQTLFIELYRTTEPVNIVGEGEGDGEHLVEGDQGDGQDGGAAGHAEHEAYTANPRISLQQMFILS